MARSPNFARGRDLTILSVVGIIEDEVGDMDPDGSDISLKGAIDYIRFEFDPTLGMIQSIERTFANYIHEIEDLTVVIGEIKKKRTGVWVPVLPSIAANYDALLVKCMFAGEGYNIYLRRGRFNDGAMAFGKHSMELTGKPIDIGGDTGNPVTKTVAP